MLNSRAHWFACALTVLCGVGAASFAQVPAASAFEVASIKPNTSGNIVSLMDVSPGGVFTGTNVTLRTLIQNAYGVRTFQVEGGPDWMRADHYDVIAKAPQQASGRPSIQPMLRALLTDRFKLVSHMEAKELPIFALIKARSDGKLGPWIRPTTADCAAMFRTLAPGTMPTPPSTGELPTCMTIGGLTRYAAGNRPIAALVQFLDGHVERLVVDRTGLIGNFDLNLEFMPDPLMSTTTSSAEAERPSILTALQEQLGLKLESTKGPVDVVVIDHVEHATEN